MVVVIGGNGFVGSRLIQENPHFKVLDKALQGDDYCDIRIANTLEGKLVGAKFVVLLAAEHRDDVSPVSKYYDTNVDGTQNVLDEMDRCGCKNLIFTSSVAVYGLNKENPNESHETDPFNDYGKSKLMAEKLIKKWYDNSPIDKSVTIIRPTVIFGEKNRGNVYNLLSQIDKNRFLVIGKGQNKKSMAYVANVVDFIKHRMETNQNELRIFNYADKPDLTIKELAIVSKKVLNKKNRTIHIPIWIGYLIGYIFDVLSFLLRKNFLISLVRIQKFTAKTQFDSVNAHSGSFNAKYSLEEGLRLTLEYEFLKE